MKTESNIYFVKATQPVNNPWRTSWLTLEEAKAKAAWFVREWLQCGIQAEACVFYRDGSIVHTER